MGKIHVDIVDVGIPITYVLFLDWSIVYIRKQCLNINMRKFHLLPEVSEVGHTWQ